MKCKTLICEVYLCSSQVAKVCRFGIGLKLLCKTLFHIFARSQPPKSPQALPNWLLKRKKKVQFRFSKSFFFVPNTEQCALDDLFLKYAVLTVCFSELLLTALLGKCVR